MNESKRERLLNLIGLGLLVFCFVLSLTRIFGRLTQQEQGAGRASIRFAHWQLESGLRDAYDRLAADYMRLHPDVHVEQMPVPEMIYANWLRTQLIGGTAPEIIELDGAHGESNEILANYCEPVTPYLERPNPYNAHNDLADVPWRETFIDGLSHAYNQELLQYYDIPSSMHTVRMFYNRPLWRKVFGSETPPRTYEEMMVDCRRAAAYRDATGQPILPVAASQNNAPFIMQRLFSSQTQRLFYSLARPGELFPGKEELALDFLSGKVTLEMPSVQDGLELTRGLGQFLPAGFLQLKREDALFTFSQGRALMTVTGSWDAPSIRSQASFDVGVFAVPVPSVDDPRYGRNTVGAISEAGTGTGLNFIMTRQASAAKQAQVIDFLQFMTSRDANRKFSDDSGWLPAVVGVDPRPDVRPFLPLMKGYPAGFSMGLAQGEGGGSFGTETGRVEDTNMYQLFEVDGGPAAYTRAVAGLTRPALIRDFNTMHRDQLVVVTRQDTTLAAFQALDQIHAQVDTSRSDVSAWTEKVSELDELQTQEEIAVAARRWKLGQLGIALEK